MKILAVSDEEHIYGKRTKIQNIVKQDENIDLLISCGDLSPSYLEFLINYYQPRLNIMTHGNHDENYYKVKGIHEQFHYNGYNKKIYQGLYIINQGFVNFSKKSRYNIDEDLTIGGFSGAMTNGERPFYFSEKDANQFYRKEYMISLLKKIFGIKTTLDIMISHSAPAINNEIPNLNNAFHTPSEGLAKIYETYKPTLWLYGHIHPSYTSQQLDFIFEDKENNKKNYLLNVIPYKLIDFDLKTKEVKIINN